MTDKTAPQILEAYIQDIASHDLTEAELQNDEVVAEYLQDVRDDLRFGQMGTNIPPEDSWPFEVKSVAIYLADFEGFTGYIGWTYLFGGGGHSDPSEIDWVESAYFLDLVDELEVITVVRTFEKV